MIAETAIHGYPIIGYMYTETQNDKECGIVLVDRGEEGGARYVTGWYRSGDSGWSHGHYFTDLVAAGWDLASRAVGRPL